MQEQLPESVGGYPIAALREPFRPGRCALLIVDVQNDFCSDGGHFARHGKDLSMIQAMLPNLRWLLGQARELGILPVFIQQTTLPNGLSDSPAWRLLKTRDKSADYTLEGSWGQDFVEGITPVGNEPVVKKFRSSAFVNTSLDLLLRSNGIESLAICGVITEGCVESTLRHAAFLDYYVCLMEDCVGSPNAELHRCSLTVMKARHPVLTSRQMVQLWRG